MPAACTNSYTPHNNAETGTVTLTLWIRKQAYRSQLVQDLKAKRSQSQGQV